MNEASFPAAHPLRWQTSLRLRIPEGAAPERSTVGWPLTVESRICQRHPPGSQKRTADCAPTAFDETVIVFHYHTVLNRP